MKIRSLTKLGIFSNFILFLTKLFVGIISGSQALISDAINSFMDIISSTFTHIAIIISEKKPDTDHPFGHQRAEPIAGLVLGVLAAILGLEVIKTSIQKIISPNKVEITIISLIFLIAALILKIFLAKSYMKKGKEVSSPALKAQGFDYRNDALISTSVVLSVIFSSKGLYFLDGLVSLFVGFILIKSSYNISKENILLLMGTSAPKEKIDIIKQSIISIPEIKNFHDLKTQYIGNKIQIEVHIEVDGDLTTKKSHKISNELKYSLESLSFVNNVFIHVDPT